jgi:hypothetical protein
MIATIPNQETRQRLERLITLTPPGALQEQYRKQLTALLEPEPDALVQLRTERDRVAERWVKGADFLDELAARVGQDSPEYDRWFAEWEKINVEYKRLDDLYYALLEKEWRKVSTIE